MEGDGVLGKDFFVTKDFRSALWVVYGGEEVWRGRGVTLVRRPASSLKFKIHNCFCISTARIFILY